jgi:hypothetical protein
VSISLHVRILLRRVFAEEVRGPFHQTRDKNPLAELQVAQRDFSGVPLAEIRADVAGDFPVLFVEVGP